MGYVEGTPVQEDEDVHSEEATPFSSRKRKRNVTSEVRRVTRQSPANFAKVSDNLIERCRQHNSEVLHAGGYFKGVATEEICNNRRSRIWNAIISSSSTSSAQYFNFDTQVKLSTFCCCGAERV